MEEPLPKGFTVNAMGEWQITFIPTLDARSMDSRRLIEGEGDQVVQYLLKPKYAYIINIDANFTHHFIIRTSITKRCISRDWKSKL